MPRKKATRKKSTRARKTATKRKVTKRKTTKRAKTTRRATKRATGRKTTRKTAKGRKTTRARKTTKGRKTTRKTTKGRKATKRKATARTTAKKISFESTAIRDGFNKSQIMTYLADHSELSKKQVNEIFDALGNLMHRHLKKGGAGEFTIPGLMKCKVKRKPATKARKGINPFTGEPTTFKAKPARNIVKVRPLKKLKEMVE